MSQLPERRVPIRYFLVLREILAQCGVELEPVLAQARIAAERFTQPEATLTASEVDALVQALEQVSGRQDLGFELGRRIKMNSHDLLGYGLMSCANMEQFLRMTARHYHLMTETWRLAFRPGPQFGEAIYTPAVAMPAQSLRFYMEALALAHYSQLDLMLGSRVQSYDIEMSMPEPAHVKRYAALAPARVHFVENQGIPGLRVRMPNEMLHMPLPLGNAEVARQIDERCQALGQRPDRADVDWREFVTMVLRDGSGKIVTLEEVAQRVNVSARTIDRHLKREGLGFRQLADQVRFEIACELLSGAGAKVSNVALQLGFSDTANFSRAFKRVVGVSPSDYQQGSRPS